MAEEIFNPLDKKNLGDSIAEALLRQLPSPLPPENKFSGAGIYSIYYTGKFEAYKAISDANSKSLSLPIYIGKAIPAGGRKGIPDDDADIGPVLFKRLSEHAESIKQASSTLDLTDFKCRYLQLDDIWIPLGETLLIRKFAPLWNRVLDGFGNHTPGKGRFNGECPSWDTVHPGREWASKCQPNKKSVKELLAEITNHLRRQ